MRSAHPCLPPLNQTTDPKHPSTHGQKHGTARACKCNQLAAHLPAHRIPCSAAHRAKATRPRAAHCSAAHRAHATSPRAAHCIANNPRTVQRTARTGNQSCSNQTHVIPFACSSPVSPPPVRGDKRRGFHPGGGNFIRFVFDLSRYKLLVPGPHHRGEPAKKKVSKKSYSEGFMIRGRGQVRWRRDHGEACGDEGRVSVETLPGRHRSCVWHVRAGTCCLRPSGVRLPSIRLQRRDNARQDRSHG